ncbi:hypothetical protein BJ742DRAFT_797639 [Cladochytrium replicatum]|nr:hypothetical protein BJ742DRAFT_797639 [Cladochytrium replicatum]
MLNNHEANHNLWHSEHSNWREDTPEAVHGHEDNNGNGIIPQEVSFGTPPDLVGTAAKGGKRVIVHTIRPSDTLAGLSILYGIKVEDLKRANKLWYDSDISLRTTIIVPLEFCRLTDHHLRMNMENAPLYSWGQQQRDGSFDLFPGGPTASPYLPPKSSTPIITERIASSLISTFDTPPIGRNASSNSYAYNGKRRTSTYSDNVSISSSSYFAPMASKPPRTTADLLSDVDSDLIAAMDTLQNAAATLSPSQPGKVGGLMVDDSPLGERAELASSPASSFDFSGYGEQSSGSGGRSSMETQRGRRVGMRSYMGTTAALLRGENNIPEALKTPPDGSESESDRTSKKQFRSHSASPSIRSSASSPLHSDGAARIPTQSIEEILGSSRRKWVTIGNAPPPGGTAPAGNEQSFAPTMLDGISDWIERFFRERAQIDRQRLWSPQQGLPGSDQRVGTANEPTPVAEGRRSGWDEGISPVRDLEVGGGERSSCIGVIHWVFWLASCGPQNRYSFESDEETPIMRT